MWVGALRNESDFEAVTDLLSHKTAYKRTVTGTGGIVAQAPPESGCPHFILLSEDPLRTLQLVQWVQRHLYPTALISSGLDEGPVPATPAATYFVPALCLRSAGRIDIGGGPVIFEEMPFDAGVQTELAQILLNGPAPADAKLFGANRPLTTLQEHQWLAARMHCEAADSFTADLLITGKRLGLKVGCFKVRAGSAGHERLAESWSRLLRHA